MMRPPGGGLAEKRAHDDDERVPVFGTWPRIYAAVVLNALAIMALIALFSRWPY
jgi:hypothetical protein